MRIALPLLHNPADVQVRAPFLRNQRVNGQLDARRSHVLQPATDRVALRPCLLVQPPRVARSHPLVDHVAVRDVGRTRRVHREDLEDQIFGEFAVARGRYGFGGFLRAAIFDGHAAVKDVFRVGGDLVAAVQDVFTGLAVNQGWNVS